MPLPRLILSHSLSWLHDPCCSHTYVLLILSFVYEHICTCSDPYCWVYIFDGVCESLRLILISRFPLSHTLTLRIPAMYSCIYICREDVRLARTLRCWKYYHIHERETIFAEMNDFQGQRVWISGHELTRFATFKHGKSIWVKWR